jgi:prepilin-type processing-associated H-X9-DG protein
MIEYAAMDRRGFTLVELLAIIAIVALLTGVLSPSLWSARQQARGVVCSSGIRQLGMAAGVYEEANGTFPHGFDDSHNEAATTGSPYSGDPVRDRMGRWWLDQIAGIGEDSLDRGSVAWCPSRKLRDPGNRANVLCGNYGVNRAIFTDAGGMAADEFAGRPPGSGQIKRPAATLLLVDSGYALISWRGAAETIAQRFENAARDEAFYVPGLSINCNRTFSSMFHDDAVAGRHPGRTVNSAYADGHVDTAQAEKLLVEQVGASWVNRSPLWLP